MKHAFKHVHVSPRGYFRANNTTTMRTPLLAAALLFSGITAQAQLVNGSFESDGQGDLSGWNNSCGSAVILPGGAPGCGDWHVGYPMHPMLQTTCNNSFDVLYQELPWITSQDQVLTIGFWSRTPMEQHPDYFFGVECRLSCLVNNVFSPVLNSGNGFAPSTDWTYHVVTATTNTWQATHAPFLLGFVGDDTTETRLMELDGIEILSVEGSTGIASIDPARVLGYYDPAIEAVILQHRSLEPVRIIDAAGRTMCVRQITASNATLPIGVADLAPGVYTAISGARYLRFMKR